MNFEISVFICSICSIRVLSINGNGKSFPVLRRDHFTLFAAEVLPRRFFMQQACRQA